MRTMEIHREKPCAHWDDAEWSHTISRGSIRLFHPNVVKAKMITGDNRPIFPEVDAEDEHMWCRPIISVTTCVYPMHLCGKGLSQVGSLRWTDLCIILKRYLTRYEDGIICAQSNWWLTILVNVYCWHGEYLLQIFLSFSKLYPSFGIYGTIFICLPTGMALLPLISMLHISDHT